MMVTVSPIAPANQPPVANAGPDQTVTAGTQVTFDGSGSTDDHGIINYTWTFTYNGTTVTLWGMNPTFTFWVAGNYTARCTVTDADGDTGFDDVLITVTPVQAPGEPDNDSPGNYLWIILILILAIVGGILGYWLISRRGKEHPEDEPEESTESVAGNPVPGIGIPIKHGPNKPSGKREAGDGRDMGDDGVSTDLDSSKVVPGVGVVVKSNNPKGGGSPDDNRYADDDGNGMPSEKKSKSGHRLIFDDREGNEVAREAGNPIRGVTVRGGTGDPLPDKSSGKRETVQGQSDSDESAGTHIEERPEFATEKVEKPKSTK
jgi:hypothetical protein